METSMPPELTSRQEELLQRFFDGALGRWGKKRAEKLLRDSDAARFFFRALGDLNVVVREGVGVAPTTDLWQRIDARIYQEERAARFLGRRVFVKPESMRERWAGLSWGLSGAALAASVVAIILAVQTEPAGQLDVLARQAEPAAVGAEIMPVGYPAERFYPSYYQNQQGAVPAAVERYSIDHLTGGDLLRQILESGMASGGTQIEMIRDPNSARAIIRVKRRLLLRRRGASGELPGLSDGGGYAYRPGPPQTVPVAVQN